MDVLEMLRGARVTTVRATIRVWSAHHERTVELWLQPPDLAREETRHPHGRSVGVRRGRTWWWWDSFGGAYSNEDDLGVDTGLGREFAWLVDASSVIPFLDLGEVTRGTCAGRPTLRMRARQLRDDGVLDEGWIGAFDHDEVLLDVDEERGVILRLECRIAGRADEVSQVLDVVFDEPIPPETFVFVPPPGERVQTMDETGKRSVTLEEAVELAQFTVWVPSRLPPGWELFVDFRPGQLRRLVPPMVHLACFPPRPGYAAVTMRQQRAYGRPDEACEQDGTALIHLERDGTAIHLRSDEMGAEALLAWAEDLVPVS